MQTRMMLAANGPHFTTTLDDLILNDLSYFSDSRLETQSEKIYPEEMDRTVIIIHDFSYCRSPRCLVVVG